MTRNFRAGKLILCLFAFAAVFSRPRKNCWHHMLGIFAGAENTSASSAPMIGACANKIAVPARSRRFTVA